MIDQHSIEVFAPEISDRNDLSGGNFVAVHLENFSAESAAASAVYSRKDFYKISLINGHTSYFHRDREYQFNPDDWGLVFTNRDEPYRWEVHTGVCNGYACMFTEDFFPLHTHTRPSDWAVFNGDTQSVFKLNDSEKIFFEALFKKMLVEISGICGFPSAGSISSTMLVSAIPVR